MSLSKFNQQWYDMGRANRFTAQLTAHATKQAVQLPLATHNATAFAHWRNGWNSPTLSEIKDFIKGGASHAQPMPKGMQHIDNARKAIQGLSPEYIQGAREVYKTQPGGIN